MSWLGKIGKIGAGWAVNPVLGNVMGGKEILGQVNKIPGRGYDSAQDKQQEIEDLYKNRQNPYDKYYDPRMRQYQTNALDRLYKMSSSKELDPVAQAQLNQIRQKEGQIERGSREAIMQNADERGAGSSTGNLLDQMVNAQGASERRTNQDMDVASAQWKRALDALYGSQSMAKDIGGQDMQRAKAQDLFSQYNTSGRARALGEQGQLGLDKAQAENQFWGGLIGTTAGAVAGGPAGASMGGNMGSGMFNDQQLPTPEESYYGGGWQY